MIVMRLKPLITIATLAAAICFAQPPVQLKVVKSSPFSAHAVTQSTQELADGNRITHQTTALIARDSDGRTRREQSLAPGSVSAVFIQDPVAGVVYVLDPQSHTARKIVMAMPETDSPPAETKNSESIAGNGRKDVSNTTSEALGIQIIEGFVVHGVRSIHLLPAGETGNERPLEVVSEAWYSDELQTLVMSRTLDPRIGEIAYKLTELRRGEPERSLFEVPGDYTIRDEPAALDSRSVEKAKNN